MQQFSQSQSKSQSKSLRLHIANTSPKQITNHNLRTLIKNLHVQILHRHQIPPHQPALTPNPSPTLKNIFPQQLVRDEIITVGTVANLL